VLEGWRASTIDVDVRFEPESDTLLRELVTLKERLGINIELASLPDFIPELPGWRERSPLSSALRPRSRRCPAHAGARPDRAGPARRRAALSRREFRAGCPAKRARCPTSLRNLSQ
jgi:hypothetical protein